MVTGQIVGWMIENCSPVGVYMPQLVHSTHLDVPTKHYSLDVKLETTIIDDPQFKFTRLCCPWSKCCKTQTKIVSVMWFLFTLWQVFWLIMDFTLRPVFWQWSWSSLSEKYPDSDYGLCSWTGILTVIMVFTLWHIFWLWSWSSLSDIYSDSDHGLHALKGILTVIMVFTFWQVF